MAERVRFFGTNDADIFELRRISRSGEEIQLRATLKWHWLPKRWRQLTVKAAELEALADWVDNFWNEVPPLEIAGGIIKFDYWSRESIGDGYFDIYLAGQKALRVYEQLGASNRFRAVAIRSLLS